MRAVPLTLLALLSLPVAAGAAEFRSRAAGHVFQCGQTVVELPRDGAPTLSRRDDPTIRAAVATRWRPDGVMLSFGKQGGSVTLSEFGSTVSLKDGRGSAVCVKVR